MVLTYIWGFHLSLGTSGETKYSIAYPRVFVFIDRGKHEYFSNARDRQ